MVEGKISTELEVNNGMLEYFIWNVLLKTQKESGMNLFLWILAVWILEK